MKVLRMLPHISRILHPCNSFHLLGEIAMDYHFLLGEIDSLCQCGATRI